MKPTRVRRYAVRLIAVASIGLGIVLAGGVAASANGGSAHPAPITALTVEWS